VGFSLKINFFFTLFPYGLIIMSILFYRPHNIFFGAGPLFAVKTKKTPSKLVKFLCCFYNKIITTFCRSLYCRPKSRRTITEH